MENNNNAVSENEVREELCETPVVVKDNWWNKTKKFGKKHKKGLIAGAIGLIATVLFCATRNSDEDEIGGSFEETTEVETTVETTEE